MHFISRCVPWESWQYKSHALQVELQTWSNVFFKTFVQRAKSTKHTDAEHIVYSPTSLKQFEHCFIFLFTHPLHLSQSPHKNCMHLCQRVSLGLFSFLPKSLLWFLYPLSWRHSNREENGSLTSAIHADQARPEGKGGLQQWAARPCWVSRPSIKFFWPQRKTRTF